MGHLTGLLSKITPAVEAETITKENRTSSNADFVENVAEINVRKCAKEVLGRSEIIKDLVEKGKVGIIGAMYDVTSGKVQFYEDTFLAKTPVKEGLQVA
jgi:carbonic anhydrase